MCNDNLGAMSQDIHNHAFLRYLVKDLLDNLYAQITCIAPFSSQHHELELGSKREGKVNKQITRAYMIKIK